MKKLSSLLARPEMERRLENPHITHEVKIIRRILGLRASYQKHREITIPSCEPEMEGQLTNHHVTYEVKIMITRILGLRVIY